MSELRPLEHLAFAPAPRPNPNIGAKGVLKWIPISQLCIDPAYQRTIFSRGAANVKKIVEAFSWSLFAALVVAPRGKDQYAIIDGQHRATAAMMHGGITEVPCLVLAGGRALEAKAFATINGNVTRLHLLQTFRARCAAGDIEATGLVAFCQTAGVTIAPYPKQNTAPGETLALGTLMQCRKRYGDEVLSAALKLLREAGGGDLLLASTIAGACAVFAEKPDWRTNLAVHIGTISRRGLGALHSEALTRRAARGGKEEQNFAAVLKMAITAPANQSQAAPRRVVAEGQMGDPGAGRSWWDRKKAIAELGIPAFLQERGYEARAMAGGLNFQIDGVIRDLKFTLALMNKERRKMGLEELDAQALTGEAA